jgi:hypothetical protein
MLANNTSGAGRNPERLPSYSEASIKLSLQLEAAKRGEPKVVTAKGELSSAPAEGVSVSRSSGWLAWSISNNTGQPISILAPSGKSCGVSVGESVEVSAYSTVKTGGIEFVLPGAPLKIERSLVLEHPTIKPRRADATAAGESKDPVKHFVQEIFESVQMVRESAIGSSGSDFHSGAISRQKTYEAAVRKIQGALDGLNIEVNRSQQIDPELSYDGALIAVLEATRKASSAGGEVVCPCIMTPDPSRQSPELTKISQYMEREVTTLLIVQAGLALRERLKGKMLSPVLREHPERATIHPETDVVLFLHAMGLPFSRYFFDLGSKSAASGVKSPRLKALEIIRSQSSVQDAGA